MLVFFKFQDAPLGQLPYLTVDGTIKLPQSISIARFLAKRFNLCGVDDVSHAKCDVRPIKLSFFNYYKKDFNILNLR